MRLLGVRIDELSRREALERALRSAADRTQSTLCFVNLDCLRLAETDAEYRSILERADLVLPDGIGLRLVARTAGTPVVEDCNGTDLCPKLLESAAGRGLKTYLLGGREGVAAAAAERLALTLPGLRVVGTHAGYFSDDRAVVDAVNASGADILLVALGVPAQEKWIARHRAELRPSLCLGVGAYLDYLSGRIRRAPQAMRRLRLEWLWRIGIEPGRMAERYLLRGIPFLAAALWAAASSRGRKDNRRGA